MRLRAAREASGKTQKQVAKEAGIAEQQYQQYEYSKRVPSAITATRIAKALGTTVEALYGDDKGCERDEGKITRTARDYDRRQDCESEP
ncbi:MAG: helix-turn-helix domain-containing protein [Oscillospiraceae bacterium]|nr:helix-turn-helix domain-containing protein [Oscillospiraceae bacterium]